MSGRTILHADLDAFYAAVEQCYRPELRGKPVAVGGPGPRSVVLTASYEARRFGVHSAMPSALARRRCPQLLFVAPRMGLYAEIAAQVRAILESFTPLVEPLSLDEAFLDVTGSEALFGDGERIARTIRERVRRETGLTISIGVAQSKFVAKVASDLRKPDALVLVPPGTERAFLAPLPVRVLWGAGKVTQALLERNGLRTVGDLQRLTREALVGLLGTATGSHFHDLANAVDPRVVEPEREARSLSHEVTFWPDLVTHEACENVLLRLSEQVGSRLRAEGLRARRVRLKLRDPDFATRFRQATLEQGTCADLTIFAAAKRMYRALRPRPAPVRLLGVGVALLQSAPQQGEPLGAQERYLTAVDRIRARFGNDAIRHGSDPDLRHGG